jgi:hypothetical protein
VLESVAVRRKLPEIRFIASRCDQADKDSRRHDATFVYLFAAPAGVSGIC